MKILSPMQRFWRVLSHYQKQIRQIYYYAIIIGIVNLSLPLGIQAIITFILSGELTSSWFIMVGFVLLGIAINGILLILQLRIVENIQQDIFTNASIEFSYRIPKINPLNLEANFAPELVNRFFDVMTIQKGLPKILIDFSLALFQIFFGLLLLSFYSPFYIMLGAFLSVFIYLIFHFTGPKGLETSLKESKFKYKLVHWLEEIARNTRSFKMNAYKKLHIQKSDKITTSYLHAREKHFNVLVSQYKYFVLFKIIMAVAFLVLGSLLVIQEQMTIGQFVAAEIVIILIINSIEKVILVIETIYDVLTALEKIGYVTDLELDKNDGNIKVNESKGLSMQVKNMSFKFPQMKDNIFESINFSVDGGSSIIITGDSGSGKSTLLQLLAGIYEPNSGDIFIDDIPINHYDKDDLYNNIGFYFLSSQLFEGTIRDNITLGREVTDETIIELSRLLTFSSFITSKKEGLNFDIDPSGQKLPRSIIQKILIARILVAKPKLLILEDPLRFFDTEEKNKIIDYIMSPDKDWTVIVVSEYPYWKKKCTKVIQLENN